MYIFIDLKGNWYVESPAYVYKGIYDSSDKIWIIFIVLLIKNENFLG